MRIENQPCPTFLILHDELLCSSKLIVAAVQAVREKQVHIDVGTIKTGKYAATAAQLWT